MVHVALSLGMGKPSPRNRVLYPSKVAFRGRQTLVRVVAFTHFSFLDAEREREREWEWEME